MGISKYENAAAVDEALDKGVEAFEKTQGGFAAENVSYDNSKSEIEAANVQDAIDTIKDEFYTEITHVNTSIAGCAKAPNDEIATIGQSLYVAEVDEDGKPTKWAYTKTLMDPSDLPYAKIADIVRSGKAEEVFKIGDQITTTYTDADGNRYNMPWDVVMFREVELEDGSIVPGMIIQSHYATVEDMQFDNKEPSSPDSNIQKYGWNRWSYSNIRQWLNSDKAKGLWWTSAHSYDVAPDNLSAVNGFMKGLPSDFLNMLKPTKHETALSYKYPSGSETTYVYDTTYDVFFLPSVKEEHFKWTQYPNRCDNSNREGSTWVYWIQRKGSTPQDFGTSYKNTNAIRYSLADRITAKTVWLRSAARDYSFYEFNAHIDGSFVYNTGVCSYSLGCAPACVIC